MLIQAAYDFVGQLQAKTLRVDPGGPGPTPLYAIGLKPLSLIGGGSVLGTVGLAVPAPAGGTVVSLESSDTSLAQVPASVTVAPGNSTVSFAVTTSPVQTFASVSVTGTAGGVSKTGWLNLGSDPNAPLTLLEISPSVAGQTGGNPIPATLFMNKAAPAGGVNVTLSSNNPAAAQVPATVHIQAGLGFASFNITTSPVAADTPVTITGVFNDTRTTTITVLAPPNALASLSLNPASVVGGSPSTGTATLTSAAPPGGRVVSLSSANPAVATVPASVTVPANATSATFPVTTSVVASTTTVILTGSAGGLNRNATLTVTPSGGGGGAFRSPTANAADTADEA